MTDHEVYRTCSIKRHRRTNSDLNGILTSCKNVIAEEGKITLRHLFYRVESLGLIEKTESDYRKLSGYTMRWRREGLIPWQSFVDSTRWYHGVRTYSDLSESLENSMNCYRRNLWQSQKAYVEVWTEKEAIAAIAQQAAEPFGVPVFPMKGFASGSALYAISENVKHEQEMGKDTHVVYLGDHDPSGRCIDESIVRNLTDDFGVDINFTRIAVTEKQIKDYDLPTRPTKSTDPRARKFDGDSVEIDAIPPHIIRELVTDNIVRHIDGNVWEREQQIESMERDTMIMMVDAFNRGGFGVTP